jgi:hypothetical protein
MRDDDTVALRSFALCIVVWVAWIAPTRASASLGSTPPPCIPADQCCAICDTGKACGNSCISRAKQCHKGRGCACDASEVCADGS